MFDFAPQGSPPPHLPGLPRSTSLQQSALWLAATRRLGSDAAMVDLGPRPALVLRRKLKVVGHLALLSRARLDMPARAASNLRRQLGVQHLAINAETQEDGEALATAGFRKIFAPREIAELTLDPSSDVMAARLAQKWRNRLRHGQAQGLTIRRRPMPPDTRFWLFKAEARQSLRKWYQPLAPDMVAALAASNPGAVQVFTAYHLGRRVAAMLFVRHGHDATYQIGLSTDEGRALSAGPALMWRAMVELEAMGTQRIDLGAADKSLAPGLARFKRGTGAKIRPLGGTWVDSSWVLRRAAFAALQAA